MRSPRRKCHYSCGKRYHAYWSGTATGRRLQLSGGYFCKPCYLTSRHNNIRAELWRKLAVNCVINPLTAILNCPNGELRHHQQEIMQICEEVAAVIEREGHHTSAEDLRDYVMQVIDATAENISSMLQDIRAAPHRNRLYQWFLLRRARMGLPYRKTPACLKW
ncbi:hypothetical protein DMI65_06075 [Escherichia coli]|nr:hypothetical protein [Escherichia coli]